uniref:Soil-associated protein, TIGR03435 family n=1 Tax=Solibacter usitatus (strain Ellin6076) TaxID=234267 RepID=Q021X2_SOLUE
MRMIVTLALAAAAYAQQFEVVSIKPADPNEHGSSGRTTPGTFEMHNTTLKTLVRAAYALNEYQLEGGPKWLDSERFNLVAKFPQAVPRDQTLHMLQAMLADRFHLEIHRVTKTLPEFALVIAKGGPKLQEASGEDRDRQSSSQGDRMIKGRGMPVASLAEMLISAVGAPVVDRTGLTGKYTFSLAFAPLQGTPRDDEPLPTIFTVLQEQLGLKLEAIKGPVQVVVIDRAERPAEN